VDRAPTGAWEVLQRGGLPLAGGPGGAAPSAADLAAAVRAVRSAPDPPGPRATDALRAFVLAWAGHWPTSFAAAFGDEGPALVGWARAGDADRLLKLRRIAVARLATVL
jgi:hypothetical protein